MSYQHLPGSEPKDPLLEDPEARSQIPHISHRWSPSTTLLCVMTGVFCFLLGSIFGAGASYCYGMLGPPSTMQDSIGADGRLEPAGSIQIVTEYHQIYSDPPTIESERAWSDLPPIGGGFVNHPSSPYVEEGVAVWHQLHCLHGIRLAYYYALMQTNETLREEIGDQMKYYGDHELLHTAHCFDYLRQALICAADSNLEVYNFESHHIDAFGHEKKCRDYEALTAWAIEWRTSNRTGITTAHQRPGILNGGLGP